MFFLHFFIGLFFTYFSFDVLWHFVNEDKYSFLYFGFFDWLKMRAYNKYLERKIKETRYSIHLVFRRIGKM